MKAGRSRGAAAPEVRSRGEPAPDLRVRAANDRPVAPGGAYVLYWMIAARRPAFSHALDRAVALARELRKPLLVLEPLRAGYPWASDRLHRFVMDGMAANARAFARAGASYLPYLEPEPGAGKGLLEALAARAAAVVTDDWPAFFLPRMVAAAAARLPVRLEAVDGNGLLPMRAAPRLFLNAQGLRRFLQGHLAPHLRALPSPAPLEEDFPRRLALPDDVLRRWPPASGADLAPGGPLLARLPIDHAVPPAPLQGGCEAGAAALASFVEDGLARYGGDRSRPDEEMGSGLSPYLHFGHVGAHQAFLAVAAREGWAETRLSWEVTGQRLGWWGLSEGAESFLDELVTWRELGFNMCHLRPDHLAYGSLPEWARATLAAHASDPRPHRYGLAELEAAATHDPLWNAAQRELLGAGRIHSYLRMLWGKKILEWSPSPEEALRVMLHLNDRYALDGRDPNSATGIFWVLGRYDRPWAPERPIYGSIRYMSSERTLKKLGGLAGYLRRWGAPGRSAPEQLELHGAPAGEAGGPGAAGRRASGVARRRRGR
ncbi:cryptochrome/DNA photolyase family protein [Anaeromyxobacter paludicola]|uniref:Deoxyribodipyrimidine photo-lyase n=1 Tax=Anaeromyxobacter paludicola TaxID=2918171 RepID=A0ABM7X7W4_9BACT|nr:deoxyribodipyrimidine photolyase [Anaeromyxobacter paludicola]BDG07936.1 deoxyribodipyrimidine photo-lyase [Anaeromyxobacter paludicola]